MVGSFAGLDACLSVGVGDVGSEPRLKTHKTIVRLKQKKRPSLLNDKFKLGLNIVNNK